MIVAKTDVAHLRLVEMFAAHDLDRLPSTCLGYQYSGEGTITSLLSASYDRKRQPTTKAEMRSWQHCANSRHLARL